MSRLARTFALLACCLSFQLFAQQSQAVALNPNGTGQVLLYPYYTVTDNQDTLISITNTRDESKLLRLTMRESLNSEIVYSFDLILRPHDHWSGVITLHNDGAALLSGDTSCTIPSSIASAQAGLTGEFAAFQFQNHNKDEINNGIERTHSGHIEVFEMGVLEASAALMSRAPNRQCIALESQHLGIAERLSAPSGGIHGYGVIINPEQGTAVNFDAEALVQFTDEVIYQPIANGKPDLSSCNSLDAFLPHNQGADILNFDSSTKAVTALFMKDQIIQDFVLELSLNAKTYWVALQPTRYLHITLEAASAPFENSWSKAETQSCIAYFHQNSGFGRDDHFLYVRDRETIDPFKYEEVPCTTSQFRPKVLCVNILESFCYAATLFDLSNSNQFQANNLDTISRSSPGPSGVGSGHLRYPLTAKESYALSSNGKKVLGLPIFGFAAQIYVNGSVNGSIANYAASMKLAGTVTIEDEQ